MQAVIKAGGKQYSVKKGDQLFVNKLDANESAELNFEALCITDGEKTQVGQPVLKGAKVVGKVLKHLRGEKIVARTYKRRKGFHKKIGHRQELTKIEITNIQA